MCDKNSLLKTFLFLINSGTKGLDHSRAFLASLLGMTHVPDAVKKQLGELAGHSAEYVRQRVNGWLLDWESNRDKSCQ